MQINIFCIKNLPSPLFNPLYSPMFSLKIISKIFVSVQAVALPTLRQPALSPLPVKEVIRFAHSFINLLLTQLQAFFYAKAWVSINR